MNEKTMTHKNSKSRRKPVEYFFPFVFLSTLLFTGCYARPTEADVERVQGRFLILRFYSVFDKSMKDLSDLALFHMSCQSNRVQCEPLLEMLEKKDPEFYRILVDEEKPVNKEILPGERTL